MEGLIIQLAGKLSAIFASFTMLVIGSIVLLRTMSLGFDDVLYACQISITAAIVSGILGYLIGAILENAKSTRSQSSKKNSDLLINDSLTEEIDKLEGNIAD